MINSKLYVITEPALVQSAFRNKSLSFEPFMVEFSQRMLGVSDKTMGPIKNIPADEKAPSFLREFVREIHTAMMGEHLNKMNASALNQVASTLNSLDVIKPESLYLWLRQMLTLATCNALLGNHSPFIDNPGLVDELWYTPIFLGSLPTNTRYRDFDAGIIKLLLNVYPAITASKAYKARTAVQSALADYYAAKYDEGPEVSQMVRGRAATYRKYDIPATDIGKFEIALLTVSTANAIPTLYWLLCNICSNPSLTQEIREEVVAIVSETKTENGKREMSVDITKFETHCPLLVSCYRETIRISNAQLGTRRVMKDTFISDGTHSYLLREGCDVQIPSGVAHLSPDYWGSDFASFRSRRFLTPPGTGPARTQKEKDDEKAQKKAYFPFGGGKHLCPGRNFAFAEILGAAAALILGFEVEKSGGGAIVVPDRGRTMFTEAVAKPRGDALKMGAKISRREGWEDVVWKFIC